MTSTTSLARALTTRRKEEATPTQPVYLGRAASQRAPNAKPIQRSQISLPVALISTTNMLSYDAPNIEKAPHVQMGGRYISPTSTMSSLTASSPSDDENSSTRSFSSHDTDNTSVDMNSPELSQAPNHLDQYFKSSTLSSARMTQSTVSSRSSRSASVVSKLSNEMSSSPQIPSRSPSHSKSAHVLSHKLSVHRSNSVTMSPEMRDSLAMLQSVEEPVLQTRLSSIKHPFGRELAQLNEVAEEYGLSMRDPATDADHFAMNSRDLAYFSINDYIDEISNAYSVPFYGEESMYQSAGWI